MNKRKDFSRFEVVELSVTAYRNGSHFVLVDKNGKAIGNASAGAIGRPSKNEMRRKLWAMWAKWALFTLIRRKKQRDQHAGDEWGTKAQTWLTSIRIRKTFDLINARRKSKKNRFFSAEKRQTWDKAFDCLGQQLSNARRCAFVSKERDAWIHWADTCGKNHRRKDLARRADENRSNQKGWPQGIGLFS